MIDIVQIDEFIEERTVTVVIKGQFVNFDQWDNLVEELTNALSTFETDKIRPQIWQAEKERKEREDRDK